MGLPIYRDSPCATPESQSSSAAKHDTTTHARSAIRRQPTIRHRPTWNTDALNEAAEAQREQRAITASQVLEAQRRLMEDDGHLEDEIRAEHEARASGASTTLRTSLLVPQISLFRSASPPPGFADNGYTSPFSEEGWDLDLTGRSTTPPRPRSRYGPNSSTAGTGRSVAQLAGHRSFQPRRHATLPLPPAPEINGLGDRQRSWSPDSNQDQWDTLLSTITPDPSLPSASSSFASVQPAEPGQVSNPQLETAHLSNDSAGSSNAIDSHYHEYTQIQHRLIQRRLQRHVRQQDPIRRQRHVPTRVPRVQSPFSIATPATDGAGNNLNESQTRDPYDNNSDNAPLWLPLEPSRTLASPSATSDSEEAVPSVSRPYRPSLRGGDGSASQAHDSVSDSSSHAHDETTTPRAISNTSSMLRRRADHAQQLRAFNDTFMDYIAISSYTDRHDLDLAPDNNMTRVMRSLSSTGRVLRHNLARQERYQFNTGVPSHWEDADEDLPIAIMGIEEHNTGPSHDSEN